MKTVINVETMDDFKKRFVNDAEKKYSFMAPITRSVRLQANAKVLPFDSRHSGPKIFDERKIRELVEDDDSWDFRPDRFYHTKTITGSSLYDVAKDFAFQMGGGGFIQNAILASAQADFNHSLDQTEITSFAKVIMKMGAASFKVPDALGNERGRKLLRRLMMPAVIKDVDAVTTPEEAENFVSRYGAVIFRSARFGGGISGTTKSSMNTKTNATEMGVFLSGEMKVENIAKGDLAVGHVTSSTDKSFSFDLDIWGGNINYLLEGSYEKWYESLQIDDTLHPISLVDFTFQSVQVLAKFNSEAAQLLEEAARKEIAKFDQDLRNMVIEKPIDETLENVLLNKIDDKIVDLGQKRNEYRRLKDRWWNTYDKGFENAMWACKNNIDNLKKFQEEIKRNDQSSESLKEWAKAYLEEHIASGQRNWGAGGNDSRIWNRTYQECVRHWNEVIDLIK